MSQKRLRSGSPCATSRSAWRGVMRGCIIAAVSVLLGGNTIAAQPDGARQRTAPAVSTAKQAFALAEAWAKRGRTPEQTVAIEAEGVTAVCVTLRLQGARLGRAVVAVDQPARRVAAPEAIDLSPLLKRGVADALDKARDALPKLRGELEGRPIPADLDRVAPMIQLDLQLAGPPRPLRLGHRRDLPRRIIPGLHGLATGKGEQWAWLFPGTVIESNLSLPGQLQRLFGELNLPPKALADIGTDKAPPIYRFDAIHLVRLSPNQPPTALRRGQVTIPRQPVDLARARGLADLWASRLMTWQREGGAMPGTYHPTADHFEPPLADPRDAALACLALGRYARLDRHEAGAADAAADAARRALVATLERIGADPDSDRPTPDDASAFSASSAAILAAAIADTPGTGALKPARDELAELVLAAARPEGGFRGAAAGRAQPAAAPEQALIAYAMVRLYDHTRRESLLAAARAGLKRLWREHDEPGRTVGLMPWIALAEFDLLRLGKGTPGLLALRESLQAVRKVQVTSVNAGGDERKPGLGVDVVGGFQLRSGLVEEPTWHTARPLLAIAAALPRTRFVGREDQSQWLVDAALGLRFLAQLTLTPDAAWYARRPSRAIGGVRTAFWDNRQPASATALALLAAVEFEQSVRALAQQQRRTDGETSNDEQPLTAPE